MPVTDAYQRVPPVLSGDEAVIDHAPNGFSHALQYRNKRLVVHHYASRSMEDYEAKRRRGAGDQARNATFRGTGFIDALIAYAPAIATLPYLYCSTGLLC